MIYDCIVVGGGPAGSICSLLLQKQGVSCLLLEKRPVIDEKICGGFIPDRCRNRMLACGVDLSEMVPRGNRVDGYFEIRNKETKPFFYKKDQYGIGVFRKDLDSFLISRAAQAGTDVVRGESVRGYEKGDGFYKVNGWKGRYLVWATGARPPAAAGAFDSSTVREKMSGQSMGISEIIRTDKCHLNSSAVYFWYTGELNDYFWAIPIAENTWNIGYWTQKNRRNLKAEFLAGRKERIESGCSGIRTIRPPRGAFLGNVDFSEDLAEKRMFCCGDLAGANNRLTGEGIAQAVGSAQKTADRILQAMKQEDAI